MAGGRTNDRGHFAPEPASRTRPRRIHKGIPRHPFLACLAFSAFFQRFCEVGVRVNTVGLGWSRLLGGSLRYMSRCPQARDSPVVWKSLGCLYSDWAQKGVSNNRRMGSLMRLVSQKIDKGIWAVYLYSMGDTDGFSAKYLAYGFIWLSGYLQIQARITPILPVRFFIVFALCLVRSFSVGCSCRLESCYANSGLWVSL